MKSIIHNVKTGEIKEIETPAEEEAKIKNEAVISKEIYNAKIAKLENDANLKASAKAKLMAGEALTEDEANTIVL